MSYFGMDITEIESDINKLNYYSNEINKDLTAMRNIKNNMEKYYTVPVSLDDINELLNSNINMLNKNREGITKVLEYKISCYTSAVKETNKEFENVQML